MIGKTNSGIILAILNISAAKSCTVTLTQSGRAFSFSGTGTYMSFKLPSAGTWTVTTQFNGLTEVKSVMLSPGEVRNLTVLDALYLYNRGTYLTGFGTGWSRSGTEQANEILIWSNTYQNAERGITTRSNGSASLANIRTVEIAYHVGIGITEGSNWGSQAKLRVTDTGGTVLKELPFGHANRNQNATWYVDVSDTSAMAKFELMVNGGNGSGELRLYSIKLIPG